MSLSKKKCKHVETVWLQQSLMLSVIWCLETLEQTEHVTF